MNNDRSFLFSLFTILSRAFSNARFLPSRTEVRRTVGDARNPILPESCRIFRARSDIPNFNQSSVECLKSVKVLKVICFYVPITSLLKVQPPIGTHFSPHSSLSFNSSTCSSVSPIILWGSMVPCLINSSISIFRKNMYKYTVKRNFA